MIDKDKMMKELLEEVERGVTAEVLQVWLKEKGYTSADARGAILENGSIIIGATTSAEQANGIFEFISKMDAVGKNYAIALDPKVVKALVDKYPGQHKLSPELSAKYLAKLDSFLFYEDHTVEEFKSVLEDLVSIGFDPNLIVGETSLLKSCLLRPTANNFQIFKYLVEEVGVKIEENLNALSGKINAQNAPPAQKLPDLLKQEQVNEFLAYIDSKTNDEQKNKCQLFNLALFFNDIPLFEKLLKNPNIKIDIPAERDNAALTNVLASNYREEITAAFIASDRFKQDQIGPLKERALVDFFQFSPIETIKLALKDGKLNQYPNFNEELNTAVSGLSSNPQQRGDAYIALYNSAKIDTMKLLSNPNYCAGVLGLLAPEANNSAYVKLLILNKPSAIDLILSSVGEVTNQPVTGLELAKLTYIMECVRDLDGLNFSHIANKEHAELLNSINKLSDRDVGRLALSLNIKDEKGIKVFCDRLTELGGTDVNAQLAVAKLEVSMQALRVEQEMSPVWRFIVTLFTDPMKLVTPLKPVTSVNPVYYLSAKTQDKIDIIDKVVGKSKGVYEAQSKATEELRQGEPERSEVQSQVPDDKKKNWVADVADKKGQSTKGLG